MQENSAFGSERIVLPGGRSLDSTQHPDNELVVTSAPKSWADVPWRTIVASVAVVLVTVVAVEVVLLTVRIIAWINVAGFFAIVLSPAVRWVERHTGGRRAMAVSIVVFTTLALIIGMISLFLVPVRNQLIAIISDLPGTVRDAANGSGTVGKIVTKLHLNSYVKNHEAELSRAADRLGNDSFNIATTALSAVLAFVTITVITFLLLTQAAALGRAALSVVPHRRRESVQYAATDAASAVSGYMIGNLLISLVAGSTSFVCLVILGIPSPFAIALWVAFADLIPLVGAILGASVGVLAAFLHSTTAGVVTLIFFVIYQQIENSVLYPAVMARKVKVNPLVVLLGVLLAVEIFGFIGAVLAVPVSGALQVVVKAINHERRGERLFVPATVQRRRRTE